MGYGKEKYNKEDELRIVSCSNVVPIKRLDLVVKTLQHISDINIKWTHFGDGIMMNQIKKMSRTLPKNIKVDFRGNVKNSDLLAEISLLAFGFMHFYKKSISLAFYSQRLLL